MVCVTNFPGWGDSSKTSSSLTRLGWHLGGTFTTGKPILKSNWIELVSPFPGRTHDFMMSRVMVLQNIGLRRKAKESRRLWSSTPFMAAVSSLAPMPLQPGRTILLSTSGLSWLQTSYYSSITSRMLHEDILPDIQAVLGPRRWNRCIFQQVWLFCLNLFLLLIQGWRHNPYLQCLLGLLARSLWWLAGVGVEWRTGLPTALIFPLRTTGFMVTLRWPQLNINRLIVCPFLGQDLLPNAWHSWRAPPSSWTYGWWH